MFGKIMKWLGEPMVEDSILTPEGGMSMVSINISDGRRVQFNWKDVHQIVDDGEYFRILLFAGAERESVVLAKDHINQVTQYNGRQI